jgi:hypothetical protein
MAEELDAMLRTIVRVAAQKPGVEQDGELEFGRAN